MEEIEITLSQEELCTYALLAHEADMKLNDWFIMCVEKRLQMRQEELMAPQHSLREDD